MTPFVVDCSVTMAWCFEDETTPQTDAALDALGGTIGIVPPIWPLEVANVLLVAERRGRVTVGQTIRLVEFLRSLPIEIDGDGDIFGSVLPLARAFNLSAYDASYLELAARRGLPIATTDVRLLQAANAAGVDLYEG